MKNSDQQAFPSQFQTETLKGLTKREYFAAMAIQGLCARQQGWDDMKSLADKAIEIADELLKQLES